MIIDTLKDVILANIGPLKHAPKGWLKSCCKLCTARGYGKDTRNRFGIQFNPTSIAANCFNCGFSASYTEGKELSGSFKFLLKHINVDDKFVRQVEFEIFRQINSIRVVRDGDENTQESREAKLKSLFHKWKPAELPPGALPITQWLEYGVDDPDFMHVVEYALSRKLYDLENFYWSPSTEFEVNRRLIIPYLYRGTNVGFTARLSYTADNRSIPKYYQQCPTDFVYNLDNQQDWSRKYLIVTEGVLDAYTTDGVGILGEVGQAKVDIINRLQKQVIVCPDRDKKGWDLVEIAIENNWAVSFPRWTAGIKDAASAAEKYGRLLTLHSIISSAITGKDRITVYWKLEQNQRNRAHRT